MRLQMLRIGWKLLEIAYEHLPSQPTLFSTQKMIHCYQQSLRMDLDGFGVYFKTEISVKSKKILQNWLFLYQTSNRVFYVLV